MGDPSPTGAVGQRFRVMPDEIVSASQAFAQQQDTPTQLAARLDGVRTTDTGEPGLNGEISSLVEEFTAALRGLTAGLTRDAQGLAQMAQSYQGADAAASGGLDRIAAGL